MTKNPELPKRRTVQLYLDTNLEKFNAVQTEFVTRLATVLNIHPEEMEILAIRRGCVKFIIAVPAEAVESLKEALTASPRPPSLQAFLDEYNIIPEKVGFDVIAVPPNIKIMNEVGSELEKPGRTITWLHISDAHFYDDTNKAALFAQDIVKEEFIKSLPNLLEGWNLNPDLVFFTGDVSFSAKREEYEKASRFLSELKKSLSGTPRFYIVPGNHDVSWDKISKDEDDALRQKLAKSPEVVKYLLSDESKAEREKSLKRFDNYIEFIDKSGGIINHPKNNNEYYYWDVFEQQGINLGVAGFNSAWLSTKKDAAKSADDLDSNNLILGEPQVWDAIKNLEKTQLRFALMHHPPESMWFKNFDVEMQTALLPKFDFVLRGHEHKTVATRISNINAENEYVHIASGALYDASELYGFAGYPICFNAVRINIDSGKGILFYWRYLSKEYKWVKDIITDNGFKIFKLSPNLLNRINQFPGFSSGGFGMHAKPK